MNIVGSQPRLIGLYDGVAKTQDLHSPAWTLEDCPAKFRMHFNWSVEFQRRVYDVRFRTARILLRSAFWRQS